MANNPPPHSYVKAPSTHNGLLPLRSHADAILSFLWTWHSNSITVRGSAEGSAKHPVEDRSVFQGTACARRIPVS